MQHAEANEHIELGLFGNVTSAFSDLVAPATDKSRTSSNFYFFCIIEFRGELREPRTSANPNWSWVWVLGLGHYSNNDEGNQLLL